MRLDVTPQQLDALPGVPQQVLVSITNPGTVIGGYRIRLLGVDPAWVELEDHEISLFPDESRTLVATVTVPVGLPAGERRMAVQVRELTPPESSEVAEVVLVVPEARSVRVSVDPVSVTAGRAGVFSVLVDNSGNTPLRGRLACDDPESALRYTCEPTHLDLGPGEHAVVNLQVTGRRPVAGTPRVRMVELHLLDGPEAAPDPAAAPAALRMPVRRSRRPAAPPVTPGSTPVAHATLVQKAWLSRGTLSLVGLLAAVTVFAVVITVALSRIVDQSSADRELALKIAAARDGSGATTGRSGIEGVVRELASGQPAPGVVVNVFSADDPVTPLLNDATGADGAYQFTGLPAGAYKLTFRGAGFVQTWFPQALDATNAEVVELDDGNVVSGLDVAIGGVPASISGTVVGDDVSDTTMTLRTPSAASAPSAGGVVVTGVDGPGDGAVVQSVPVGSDGNFSLGDVPSPAVYELVVTKTGYSPAVQRVDVGAGEERKNVEINLVEGNGIIAGDVLAEGVPVGNATITATSGQTTATALSLTDGAVGSFALRRLPTPATYTLVAAAEGFASTTLTVTLGDAQELQGVTMTLGTAAGALSGRAVTTDGQPAPGVSVTVTDGTRTVQTATRTSGRRLGSWDVTGLPVPGSYTVTLSRADLAAQTLAVTLDATGAVAGDATGTGQITTVLTSSTAVLEGTVTQRVPPPRSSPGGPVTVVAAGEVTVTLSSGARTYVVTTATRPDGRLGDYVIEGIVPGTYTISVGRSGVSPTTAIRTLVAGQRLDYSVELAVPARISGTVSVTSETGAEVAGRGYLVELYRAADYPGLVYASDVTDAAGLYEFSDVDAPENYVVQVRRADGSVPLSSATVALDPSGDETVDLRVRQ